MRDDDSIVVKSVSSPGSRRVFINGSSINLSTITVIPTHLCEGRIQLCIDAVGTVFQSDGHLDVFVMPAGTFNSLKNMLYN